MERKTFPILIVEDDEPTQKLLQAVLRRCGYASEVVGNGRDAISRLQDGQFAAVILDMMMPQVSGREVIDFLSGAGLSIPVVVCSAAGRTVLTDFDDAVVKAIVRKPFDIEVLVATVLAIAGVDDGSRADDEDGPNAPS